MKLDKLTFLSLSVVLQLWCMGLISYATITVYQMAEHSMALATIYGSTTALLGVVTGYIQKRVSVYLNAEYPRR